MTKYNYRSYFSDINRNEYKLELFHGDQYDWKEISLLDTPITIEWESSDDLLYKPIKKSGSTIGILTNSVSDYLFDLYSPNAKDCKVTLFDNNNNVVWCGYVTPSLYSMGYEYGKEELNIDCIDGLSILKYIKYTSINSDRGLHSFLDIILHILRQTECYSTLYFQKSVFTDLISDENILKQLFISENSFFDDDDVYVDGVRQTDDDDSLEDVLEKIMTYLGMTIIADGDSVYIIDYDHIYGNSGNPDFFKINIADKSETTVTIESNPTINGTDFAENGAQISLSKVFNKVTVIDKWHEVENIFPDLYDEKHLTRIYPVEEYYPTQTTPIKTDCLNFGTPNIGEDEAHGSWGLYKFYDHDSIKFYCYNSDGTETTMQQKMIEDNVKNGIQADHISFETGGMVYYTNILSGETGNGCCICFVKKYDVLTQQIWAPADNGSIDIQNGEYLGHFSFDKYVVFCLGKDKSNNTTNYSNLNNSYYIPMLKTKLKSPTLLGSENMYFVISGNFKYYDKPDQFGLADKYKRNEDSWNISNFWIPCQLYYQGQYYNGQNWQTTPCRFKLYCTTTETKHYLGKDMKIFNTMSWMYNVNETGYAIKLPGSIINDESPIFTMFRPASPSTSYRIDQLWMKDFNIKVVSLNQDFKEGDDSATAYTNIIDMNNVEELDDIEFEVCTYDQKKVSDNVVVKYENNTYTNLDTVYEPQMSNVLDIEQYPTGLARFEEIYCAKIANQYNQPNVILELALNKDWKFSSLVHDKIINKDFIIDSKSIDIRYQKFNYTLIEKR